MIRFYQTFPAQSGLPQEEVLLQHMQGLLPLPFLRKLFEWRCSGVKVFPDVHFGRICLTKYHR